MKPIVDREEEGGGKKGVGVDKIFSKKEKRGKRKKKIEKWVTDRRVEK